MSPIDALVNRIAACAVTSFFSDRSELRTRLFNDLSRIYWVHDPVNPNADIGALPSGCVRAVRLCGTRDVPFIIETKISPIDTLPPLSPVDGSVPVPESGDFVVFVQMTDRSRVVLFDLVVMPRNPRVLFGTAWEQMCVRFLEDEQGRPTAFDFAVGLGAPGVCSAPGCTAKGTKRCSGCSMVWFCSRECRDRHWPAHKARCKEVSAARKAGSASGS
jgi:hypothetical protein